MKSRVFVPQFVYGNNYTTLEKYGELFFLARKEYPREPCPETERWQVARQIKRGLDSFDPAADYLALSGSPIPNFIAGAHLHKLMNAKYDDVVKIQILKYNNQTFAYDRFIVEV